MKNDLVRSRKAVLFACSLLMLFPASSFSQTEWVMRPSGTFVDFGEVVFGNGMFLAVTNTGARWSSDGMTWIESDSVAGSSVAFGNGKFMVLSYWGHDLLLSEDNGATSKEVFRVANNTYLEDIAYGNGVWVIVANNGLIWRSSDDGTTWDRALSPTPNGLYGVTFGGGVFMAVGWGTVATSPDGYTWSLQSDAPGYLDKIAYGKGLFVGIRAFNVFVSEDKGVTWTLRFHEPSNHYFRNILFEDDKFVVVGDSGVVCASNDGVNWCERDSGTKFNYEGVAFGDDKWIATGQSGAIVASDASVVPPIPQVFITTSERVVIRWDTHRGLCYQVQSSSNLKEWTNAGSLIKGDGLEKLHEDSGESRARFYRVAVE